jgi:hypothetical protein
VRRQDDVVDVLVLERDIADHFVDPGDPPQVAADAALDESAWY